MNDHPPAFAVPALPTSAPFTTQPQQHTPLTVVSRIVPAKRKRAQTSAAPPTLHQPEQPAFPPSFPRFTNILPPQPQSNVRAETHQVARGATSEELHCICGFSHDDGFSIACDDCGRWSHMLCFDIRPGLDPDEWRCWECLPRPIDSERATRKQEDRLALLRSGAFPTVGQVPSRRRSNKERERITASAVAPPMSANRSQSMDGVPQEEENIDIEDDGRTTYVSLAEDDVPHEATQVKLRLAAQNWRGVTALRDDEPRPIKVTSLPTSRDDVRPPTYALETTAPIAGEQFIAPFTSTIIPAAAYMGDPLNGYAHIGVPKPFVHLVPRPFPVALDARMAGDQTRFARSGCRPNAVLRPVLCKGKTTERRAGSAGDESGRKDEGDCADDPGILRFALFALRDLKASEEIVLGWEWDDGSVVHQLPALIEAGSRAGPSKMTAHHIERLRLQMQTIVDSLRSNFVTCACGASVDDCALKLMEAVADGRYPPLRKDRRQANGTLGPSSFSPNIDMNGQRTSATSQPSTGTRPPTSPHDLKKRRKEKSQNRPAFDLGPLIGAERGVRTRLVGGIDSGGLRGVELVDEGLWERCGELESEERERYAALERRRATGTDVDMHNVPTVQIEQPSPQKDVRKGKARAVLNGILNAPDDLRAVDGSRATPLSLSPSPTSDGRKDREGKMPPKMRKRWIHERTERLRSELKAGVLSSNAENGVRDSLSPVLEAKSRSTRSSVTPTPSDPASRPLKEKLLNVDFDSLRMPPPPPLPLKQLPSNPPSSPTSSITSTAPEPPTPSPASGFMPPTTSKSPPPIIMPPAPPAPRRPSSLFSLLNEHPVSPLTKSLRLGAAAALTPPVVPELPEVMQIVVEKEPSPLPLPSQAMLDDPPFFEHIHSSPSSPARLPDVERIPSSLPHVEKEPSPQPIEPSPQPIEEPSLPSPVPVLSPVEVVDVSEPADSPELAALKIDNEHEPRSPSIPILPASPLVSESIPTAVVVEKALEEPVSEAIVLAVQEEAPVSESSSRPFDSDVNMEHPQPEGETEPEEVADKVEVAAEASVEDVSMEVSTVEVAPVEIASPAMETGNSLHLTEQSPIPEPMKDEDTVEDAIAMDVDVVKEAERPPSEEVQSSDVLENQAKASSQPLEDIKEKEPEPEPETKAPTPAANSPSPELGQVKREPSEPQRSRSTSTQPTPRPPQLTLSIPELDNEHLGSLGTPSWHISSSHDGRSADPSKLFDDVETLEEKVAIVEEATGAAAKDTPVDKENPPTEKVHPGTADQITEAIEVAKDSTEIAPSESCTPATTLRLPSPAFSVASSTEPAPSTHVEDIPSSAVSSAARHEPMKIRRSMADYKQRKKREREEQAARAVFSPMTPATPLREDLQVNLVAERENDRVMVKPAELEPDAGGGLEEGEVVGKVDEEHAASADDSPTAATVLVEKLEPKSVTSSTGTPSLSIKTQEMTKLQSMKGPGMPADYARTASPTSLPPSLQRRLPEKSDSPNNASQTSPASQGPQLRSVAAPLGDSDAAPESLTPPTLPRAMRKSSVSSNTVPVPTLNRLPPTQPRLLRGIDSKIASPTLSHYSRSPPPSSTASPKPMLPGWHARATSVGDSEAAADSFEPPAASAGSMADSIASSSNGKMPWKRQDDPLPTKRGPPSTASSGTTSAGATAPSRGPPPSGPRALRERGGVPPVSGRPRGPPPRGPLAERGGRRDYDRSRDIPDSDEERDRERERDRRKWDRDREPIGDRYSPQRWARSWGRGRR